MSAILVLETFRGIIPKTIRAALSAGKTVYALEPFVAFHKVRGKIVGFPDDLPEYMKDFIREGMIGLITAESIEARNIYQQVLDRAVEQIEPLWPYYRDDHATLVNNVRNIMGTEKAENVFKRTLAERLAHFHSANEVYHRLSEYLTDRRFILHADTNVRAYQYINGLLERGGRPAHAIKHLAFTWKCSLDGMLEEVWKSFKVYTRVAAQTAASLIMGKQRGIVGEKPHYKYGFSIISSRQLRDNRRGPNLLVDGDRIRPEEVAYFPLAPLNSEQNARLEKIPGHVIRPHEMGRFFSNAREWLGLTLRCFNGRPFANGEELRAASSALFHYFAWKDTLTKVRLNHFVTHCDFAVSHMGRNIALEQAGVVTWYFTDSMNFGNNMEGYIPGCRMRHPYWTYLDYDHFVTWHRALGDYFQSHPDTFGKVHVVGCIWAEHASKTDSLSCPSLLSPEQDKRLVLAVFDTTYARNITVNYREGIAFAEHILDLAGRLPNLFILFKEKKSREIHSVLDPHLGPRLIKLYEEMDNNPNISFYDNTMDASQMIGLADAVVSFPFTSTTFEALSIGKPAIWHDPLEYYRRNLYDSAPGVVTHGLMELEARIKEFMETRGSEFNNPIPHSSPLLDPFRDGKAISRFRTLLIGAEQDISREVENDW